MAHVHGAAGAAQMGKGMEGMMGKGMEGMMGKGMAAMGTAAAAATTHTGRSFMSILTKHPLVVFGLGVVAGYYAHKYRKEIILSATSVTEKGKDFVLHQKENLEDLVAECKECADDESSEGKSKGKKA